MSVCSEEAQARMASGLEMENSPDAPPIALFTRQPWANLIAEGRRTVMVKNWDFYYRGHFLIHSAKRIKGRSM